MLPRHLQTLAVPFLRQHVRAFSKQSWKNSHTPRSLVTLAIETSCDDTSVAVAELPSGRLDRLKVHFHRKVTADNAGYDGIHPLVTLHSHRAVLAPLVQEALSVSPRPDFIAATRGPGMRSNLAVGLHTAQGLALGMNVPLIGVHHMQAHALTPRLVHAMDGEDRLGSQCRPEFPFLTVLASGGHTMLINSTGLTEHAILAETQDITLGVCLDKFARAVLPTEALTTPYGQALEDFAFPNGAVDYHYTAPARRKEELERVKTEWNWSIAPPLATSRGGKKTSRRMAYSFSGLLSSIERSLSGKFDADGHLIDDETRSPESVSIEERRCMAREVQRVAFEHIGSRILLHLSSADTTMIEAVVVSGGVASNSYMRHVLRAMLDVRGYQDIELAFPPISLCTDNALMIAWAAFEMWHAGFRSKLDIAPIQRWSMDPRAEDGGILGVGGWITADKL